LSEFGDWGYLAGTSPHAPVRKGAHSSARRERAGTGRGRQFPARRGLRAPPTV